MLKQILKKTVILILNWEARLVIRKYKPKLVGITGNVGKTSTKEAIAAVLATQYKIRKSEKSYNSEFGLPLTVIGCRTAWNSFGGWLNNIYRGFILILFKEAYPEWLILEIGADRPNDIKSVVKKIKFDVAVVSRLPDVPVHIEFFKSKEQVIDEKMSLPLSLQADGLAVLNADDPNIMSRRDMVKAKVVLYGFNDNAEVRATNDHIMYEEKNGISVPIGLAFKVDCQGNNVPVRIPGAIGSHLVYPILAALAVGTELGINLVTAIEALASHTTPPGRLHLVSGINNSTILDDTYNSSPLAVEAALKTLSQIETTGRKIAVLGDMMELGSHTAEAHKHIGELASQIVSILITVGVRSKFTYETALANGLGQNELFHFDSAREAGEYLKTFIGVGDIVLVKGSQSMRMERVVEIIMAESEKKKDLLVRQEEEWQDR
jgi:UDP-N-acetylmuramoyl-tripeptide--D-alanyl-D-alanine ligase